MNEKHSKPSMLSVVVLGASGDLAVKKIFPALFSLYCRKLLPASFHLYGFARTEMSDEAFRTLLLSHLTCRYTPGESECQALMEGFLGHCSYIAGNYDDADSFERLNRVLEAAEPADGTTKRLFYLSVPPFIFEPASASLHRAGMLKEIPGTRQCRLVLEKPFGRDRASSDALTKDLALLCAESQIYRIDHYLGKEVIQNLMALRFSNLIFEPLWNRNNIEHVRISWTEEIGVEGRAGYFDQYGIIRDVMQNHLLQMLALVAMEEPANLHPESVRDEKVKVLRSIQPVCFKEIVVGQYTAAEFRNRQRAGYLEEPGIPADSRTATYAATVMHVRNRRWDDVPFLVRAGKAVNDQKAEIRIRFREVPANIFNASPTPPRANELIIRVQPDPALSLSVMTKVPGLRMSLHKTELNLSYASTFNATIPEAYESLLLDVIRGDKSLFIRDDELAASWDVFTPVLHALEECIIKPQGYAYGSNGPSSADALAALHNTVWE
ncbi:MAG: glucose-6-phosphate dehydrogenase [Candidatus Hydrogenedens sp.]|nr:glucose-6-phosphate dehydrogenase [Candidatus Hydrogenedens sp.]